MSAALLPTFVIGGAPRSGTTFLAESLARHPDVFLARPFIPEPKVLMGLEQSRAVYEERYCRYFRDAAPRQARGEKTSYYLECPDACRRLHALAPQARIVFIVREPVARAYSNWLWSRKNGLETLPFVEAISGEGQRPSPLPPEKAYARPFDYLTRGDYAALARPYFERFPRERVRFFLYEDIRRRPSRLFAELQEHLGIDPIPFERLDAGVVNSAAETGEPLDPEVARALKERMTPKVQAFARLTGLDLDSWGYAA